MEDAAATAANSGCSPPDESSNVTMGTTTGGNLANPEISSKPKPQQSWRHREPLQDRVRMKRNALIFLSLLVALFKLAKEWRHRDRPLAIALVWEISLLFITLLYLPWISFLKVTMCIHIVFLYLSNGVLLSIIAHQALSPKVRMLAIHLNTHLTAGFLGYALAKRRLHAATKKFDVPMPANQQQADRLRGLRITAGLYCSVITMGAAIRVAWVARHTDEYDDTSDLLLNNLVLFPGILTLWISFVAALLRGVLMGHRALALISSYFSLIAFVLMLSVATLGNAAAAINVWIVILGLSGFFGYSLCIYNSYKEILGMKSWDNEQEPHLKGSSSSPSSADNLLNPTTEKSDGSNNGDGTAS